MMGPEYGTEKYYDQVDRVKKFLSSVEEENIESALMLFILDPKFSRSAICQAEKEVRKERFCECS